MIHWNIVIFVIVIIALGIWWLRDYLSENSGGTLFGAGVKYESGGEGFIAFILIIVFTLIWGGIFWW